MITSKILAQKKIAKYIGWLFLCLVFLVFFIGPFIWMVSTSFKERSDIIRFPPTMFPEKWITDNYVKMWETLDWIPMFINSFWITGVSVVLILFISALGAFAFAKFRFPGRNFFFLLIIAGLIVPIQVDMIPRFLMMVQIGLVGTYIPVILLIIGQGFQTFMLRQFISTIPDEYFDAAKIDGMGYFQMFWSIVVPLSKAGIITMAIYSTFMVWNQYVYPLIYLTKPSQFTLQIGLGLLRQKLPSQFGPQMAAAAMVSIPTLIIYLIFQRKITSGISSTGLKG